MLNVEALLEEEARFRDKSNDADRASRDATAAALSKATGDSQAVVVAGNGVGLELEVKSLSGSGIPLSKIGRKGHTGDRRRTRSDSEVRARLISLGMKK